jgi:hypothetical protein
MNKSQELVKNNQTATDDKDWNIDEALGMAYLVQQKCGKTTRKTTSQFVPRTNVTEFDVLRIDFKIWQEMQTNLIYDTLNSTKMTDKIIPFVKRVKAT